MDGLLQAIQTFASQVMAGQSAAAILTLIFLAAVALAFAVANVALRPDIRRRLTPGVDGAGTSGGALAYQPVETRLLTALKPIYEPFVPNDEAVLAEVRQRLVQAGYRNPNTVRVFFAARIAMALGFGIATMLLVPLLSNISQMTLLILALAMAGLGYLAPTYIVDKLVARRQTIITNGFPDALDMLLVCVEAGLSLDAAIGRVGQEIVRAHPEVSDEFRLVGNELLAGKSRNDALKALSDRTGVQDVRNLASLLIQSDKLGTSVARALRVHAQEMRATRILRAEERAHKIPVKMAFPLMFGLIPVVLIVTLAPAIIRMNDLLFPMLFGTPTLSE